MSYEAIAVCVWRGDLYFNQSIWVETHERMKTQLGLGGGPWLTPPAWWIIIRCFSTPLTQDEINSLFVLLCWSGVWFTCVIYNGLRLFKYQPIEDYIFGQIKED